jgi:uncharacterized membrane protein YdjX (TVP38/TMEM64 family)
MIPPRYPIFQSFVKLLVFGSLLLLAIAIVRQSQIQELLRSSSIWVESLGALKPLVFILIYNLATVLFIPGSLLTMGGGAIFGLVWGSIYVTISAILGATIAFIIGRFWCRDLVYQKMLDRPQFQAIERAIDREGLKIVLLTRLCPILPFNLLNYAFGITNISLKDYVLGSLGIIPGTVMYVYLGDLVGDIAALGQFDRPIEPGVETIQWVIRSVGFIATVFMVIYFSKLAKKYLNYHL